MEFWALKLYRRLGLPELDYKIREALEALEHSRIRQRETRNTEENRRKRNKRRRERRQKDDKDNETSLYKGVQKSRPERQVQSRKRRYRVRKMPAKLGRVNPYFLYLGLTGRAEDDEEIPGCEAYSPEYDYYSDEEEEEEDGVGRYPRLHL